jgi:chloramphenicol-sensitive protein RarD
VVFVFTIISETNEKLSNFPWIPFVLPLSFSLYGLLRKQMRADSVTGLTIEMGLLLPFMIALEAWLLFSGRSIIPQADAGLLAMLLAGGVVTIVPLVAFAAAARRLRLTTLGLLQYIAPLGQFGLAIMLGESFGKGKAVAFGLILAAISAYSIDSIKKSRAQEL